ncbi:MAG: methyltransferase domain-containing protein [Bacteroidota bacterium]
MAAFFVDTRQRSTQEELMDDFAMAGDTIRGAVDQIALVNRFLGGNQVTISGVAQLLADVPVTQPVRVVDLGCGNGDMLRVLARWGRQRSKNLTLIGIDANPFIIDYARQCSVDYPEISYQCELVTPANFDQQSYDIVLCTLFLHHFPDDNLSDLLHTVSRAARLGVVINDLHRHRLAYYLFYLLTLPIPNRMVREDGLISILRGFKRHDLEALAQQVLPSQVSSQIRWRWAFRYQWLIKN